jgi:putative tryptophan/tyrosine transport system substrate-binding protein
MNRRAVLTWLGVLALGAGPLNAQPKRPDKVWKVGVLRPGADGPVFRENFAPFAPALAEFGFKEGKNLMLEFRVRQGTPEDLLALANSLVKAKVDAILAIGMPGVTAAARASKTIPIVAVDLESDPIAEKFAASLSRPGGNVTGMFLDLPELSGKWIELLSASIPKLSRASVLWDPASGPYLIKGAEAAGRAMGLQLVRHEVGAISEFEQAFASAVAQKSQAVLALSSPMFSSARPQIAALALKHRLPAVMPFPNFADSGGLMGYGPHLTSMFRQAGEVMAKILRGTRPADHPIERPTRFELAVNLSTAKALGVKLPQSVLVSADRIVE